MQEKQTLPAADVKVPADITVTVMDQPGNGGAHHLYHIEGGSIRAAILFQNGGVAENGVNGITNEALLAIVKHRLECFQAGKFASAYNQAALVGVDTALDALNARTLERIERGVEGKQVV